MEELNVSTPDGLAAAPRPSSRSSGRERCQREQCLETARKLKAECKELKAQLLPLQKNFTVLVQGETRAIHAELVEKSRQLDSMKTGFAAAKTHRNVADRAARTLAEENDKLLAKVAELSTNYASLMGRNASNVRRAGLQARQAKLREQKLQRDLSRAEATSGELAADAAAARSAEQEAEGLLVEAEERVKEAEERADEAVEDAKASATAAAAAEAQVTDAAYVEHVLTAKLHRATAKAEQLKLAAAGQRAEAQRGPKDRSVDEWAALGREGAFKAAQRERLYFTNFLKSHEWRMQDVAAALDELGPPPACPDSHQSSQTPFNAPDAALVRRSKVARSPPPATRT
jgi:chromosome segregation ATPase